MTFAGQTETIDLMLLSAANHGQITYDPDLPYGIRWRGFEADFDMANRVQNLRIDGLADYTNGVAGPVTVTHDGHAALRAGQ